MSTPFSVAGKMATPMPMPDTKEPPPSNAVPHSLSSEDDSVEISLPNDLQPPSSSPIEGVCATKLDGADRVLRSVAYDDVDDERAEEDLAPVVSNGLFVSENGDRYFGDAVNGLKHGRGTLSCSRVNETYTGEFVNDKRHGFGVFEYSNGDKFFGHWKDGKKHGKGTYLRSSCNESYTGEWRFNRKHGLGTFVHADGSKFCGFWCKGKKHGEGSVFTGGQVYNVSYRHGKLSARPQARLGATKPSRSVPSLRQRLLRLTQAHRPIREKVTAAIATIFGGGGGGGGGSQKQEAQPRK